MVKKELKITSLCSKRAQNKKSKITILSSKQGQMKIQQMAFMLMAVTLFFILIGLFVLIWSFSGLKESAIALEEENTMLLVSKLANSPEFSCGSNCIDLDKVMALKDSISKYSQFWGKVSNIEIKEIYPSDGKKECTQSNYPDCDFIDLFSKGEIGIPASNFVALCRKNSDELGVYNDCKLGKIYVFYNKNE